MRYLKKFENIDRAYYTEVPDSDYFDEMILGNIEKLTEDEISSIKNLIGNKFFIEIGPENYIKHKVYYNNQTKPTGSLTDVCFMKISDEWYYVQYKNDQFYKCDQFEGLLKCLEDLQIFKKT